MFLLNATDDPLVPPPLVDIGKEYASKKKKSTYKKKPQTVLYVVYLHVIVMAISDESVVAD